MGWKAVVVSGVERRVSVVSRGFGFEMPGGGVGWMWWRERREEGPEERSSGRYGWKVRDVMADCMRID